MSPGHILVGEFLAIKLVAGGVSSKVILLFNGNVTFICLHSLTEPRRLVYRGMKELCPSTDE